MQPWILGYHGCDRKIGEMVLRGDKEDLEVSTNTYDWLGAGAYFWENSYHRAFEWAKFLQVNQTHSKKAAINEPFVVGAIINPGNCLDLFRAECLSTIKEAFEVLKRTMEAAGEDFPKNEAGFPHDQDLVKRRLDCMIINGLHELRLNSKEPPYDTVRAPFQEGGALYDGAKFMAKTHVQITVRNPKTHIHGYFRPRIFSLGKVNAPLAFPFHSSSNLTQIKPSGT